MTTPSDATVVSVSQTDIDALRRIVGDTTLTDIQLAEVIAITMDDDGTVNINRAASQIWSTKASAVADLVDVQESGSTRKLSDLHKNALAMAKYYASISTKGRADSEEDGSTRRPGRTRPITRA